MLAGLRVALAVLSTAAILSASAALAQETPARTVTLVEVSDLHAHLVPHRDLRRVVGADDRAGYEVVMEGGLARLATLLKRIRAEAPASIVMNVGDTYHGGPEALYTQGNALVAPVNALGIDIGVPGNWDFAFGPAVTQLRYAEDSRPLAGFMNVITGGKTIERPSFPNLAANVRIRGPFGLGGDPLLPATRIIATGAGGGVKVGFIGLSSDIVPRMAPALSRGLEFVEGREAYRALVDGLAVGLRAAGAELVVVMSELGLAKNLALGDIIAPGVDIIFSAHTHELTPAPVAAKSGALVVEAGDDTTVGRMDVTLRAGASPEFGWRLIALDGAIPDDPEVSALVRTARQPFVATIPGRTVPGPGPSIPLKASINSVIAQTEVLLHRRNALDSPFNRMFAETMRRMAGTDISLTPGFRFDAVVDPEAMAGAVPKKGAVRLEDLYRYLPVPMILVTAKISGRDLRANVEKALTDVFSPDAFRQSGGWVGGFGGLEIDINLGRPDGERVISLRLKDTGREVGDDDMLSVVSCRPASGGDDSLCGGRGYVDIRPFNRPGTEKDWTPLELMVAAYAEGKIEPLGPAVVHDASGTPQWPEASLFQPMVAGATDRE